ncbi:uncharacterized protein hyal4 [Neosynchiropus ocellatus]
MPMVTVGGASSSHHAVPVALTCVWLLLSMQGARTEKPAKLPLLGRKPFIAAWNAPLDMCTIKYNVTANLDHLFHIQGSPRAGWTGQNVTIFYANRLGYYPYYTPQGVAVHGGVPQNISMDLHLFKAYQDITHFIPAEDFRGLAVIDWEFWRPQWSRNWHKKDIYRQKSRALTAKAYFNLTPMQIEELARRRFEKSARALMQKTIQLGTRLRPNGLWGFYLYPDCHNYNFHEANEIGFCPLIESVRNDELLWLWNSSTALFPAVAIRKGFSSSISNLHFARHRVREALRVASLTSKDYDLPTYVYLRLGYRDEAMAFLTTKDLIYTIGESAALGAAGFVIWGDLNLTSSRFNCTKVKNFLSFRLGQYITNVTRAAEVCSEVMCQGNGRCIRRDPQAPHYLHLSSGSYQIVPSGDGDFTVVGWHSPHELQQMTERFRCHCYEGHEGEHCHSINSVKEDDEQENEEDNEQDKRRTEWEDEQGEIWDMVQNTTPPTHCPPCQIFLSHLIGLVSTMAASFWSSLVILAFSLGTTVSSLPPTEPPLIHGHPFIAIWNAPTHRCKQLHIPLDTTAFQAVTTPAAVPGQFLTIFYEDRLGLYPKVEFVKQEIERGGVPQNGNLTEHLAKAREVIDHSITNDAAPGLAVIDWESWRPLWDQNWGTKRIYQRLSLSHALKIAPFLSLNEVGKLARKQFEDAGRRFMERTISLGIGERPSRRWGFYLFPDCYNYGWTESNYTGQCSSKTQKQNNQMMWLWEKSTALFPSVYLHLSIRNSHNAVLFVRNRVHEALRVARLPKKPFVMPVYVYTRPLYRAQTAVFQSERDLVSTVGESAALGAAGVVMWGGSKDFDNKASCQSLSDYLASTLSPYVANVTAAATLCSRALCQSKGRCVRRSYDSDHYLHLNPQHFSILRADGRYVAVGLPSADDLEYWGKWFTCQCYAALSCSPKLSLPTSIQRIMV